MKLQIDPDVQAVLEFMQANFGKAGAYYYWISRGVDRREVRPNRIRKSVGAENTFSSDLSEFEPMVAELQPLIDKVWSHCEKSGNRGRTVTLKVKFSDFEIMTRSQSMPAPVAGRDELTRAAVGLLEKSMPLPKAVCRYSTSRVNAARSDASPPTSRIDSRRRWSALMSRKASQSGMSRGSACVAR